MSPTFFVGRVKGRLQHALRVAGKPTSFSRKVSFRTIGENKRAQVEEYIVNQVPKEHFVDDRFAEMLQSFTQTNNSVRLQEPTETISGRYWYNLHVVLVTESRMRFTDKQSLTLIGDTCDRIAAKKSFAVSRRSVMPDHLHLSLRGDINQSPQDIALAYMNNIAFAFGQKAVFRPSYYVGTFGEYDMGAVRQHHRLECE